MNSCYDTAFCTYYGSLSPEKPHYGVHYHVLDEYLIQSVDKLAKRFREEMSTVISNFKRDTSGFVNATNNEIAELKKHNRYVLENLQKIGAKLEIEIVMPEKKIGKKKKKLTPYERSSRLENRED